MDTESDQMLSLLTSMVSTNSICDCGQAPEANDPNIGVNSFM